MTVRVTIVAPFLKGPRYSMDDYRSIPYFESSLAVLSTIGLCLTGVGVYIILVTRFSALHAIPVVASVACAVANGLSYHAFSTTTFGVRKVVASGFADILWPVSSSLTAQPLLDQPEAQRHAYVLCGIIDPGDLLVVL